MMVADGARVAVTVPALPIPMRPSKYLPTGSNGTAAWQNCGGSPGSYQT